MAHITEFAITGLAGRTDVYSGRFNRDVNIFFGLNGSGKTSLLKILHSAMSRILSGTWFCFSRDLLSPGSGKNGFDRGLYCFP